MSYGAQIKVPGDSRTCSVSDEDCAFRSCLWVREDPGSYVQGRGYSGGTKRLLCGNREIRGCPTPKPEPDPETVRCCASPTFAKPRTRYVTHQTCRTCGARSSGRRLELARMLPAAPTVSCPHRNACRADGYSGPTWHCRTCDAWWDHEPRRHEPGETANALQRRLLAAWAEARGLDVAAALARFDAQVAGGS